MPKPYFRSCSKSIRSPKHPCPDHNSVRFQEHTVTCSKSIRSPEHPCRNHNSVRVPRAFAHQSIHAQTIIPFGSKSIRSRVPRAFAHQSIHAQTKIPLVFQEHSLTRASMPKLQVGNTEVYRTATVTSKSWDCSTIGKLQAFQSCGSAVGKFFVSIPINHAQNNT